MAAEAQSTTDRSWGGSLDAPDIAQAYESARRRQRDDHGQLVDHLLWSVVTKNALRALPHGFRFCDAGGGSGHWSLRILADYAHANGVVLCGPEQELASAAGESGAEHEGRLRVDSTDLCGIADKSFDLTFSLHDALAVAEQPGAILRQLVRITKPGGFVAVLAPNLHDAIFLNLVHARLWEAERALTGRASFRPGAPELNVFTPRSLEEIVMRAGACPRVTVGLPMVVPSWSAGLEVHDGQALLSAALANEESRRRIVAIEETLMAQSGPAARGSDLVSIAMVPSTAHWGDFWLND